MTPEVNEALHRVQRDFPDVRWVEDDGDVILYREGSPRFYFLTEGGALREDDVRAELDGEEAPVSEGAPAAPEVLEEQPTPEPAADAPDVVVTIADGKVTVKVEGE